MSEINLMISVSRQQQVEIEEYCINVGMTVSAYLMSLHDNFFKTLETNNELHDNEFVEIQSNDIDKKKTIKTKKYSK